MQNHTEMLVKLGRYMINLAPQFQDDVKCNDWARVGNLLTGLGMPFAPRLREFEAKDQAVVRDAAAVMVGKAEMPALMTFEAPVEPKRTRKARMTKVMAKPAKKVSVKATRVIKKVTTQADAPKRRGRPPGSKNKPKVVVKATKAARKSK